MPFPDALVAEIPTSVASEILTKLGAEPDNSPALISWLNVLRHGVNDAQRQGALFEAGR